MSGFHHLSVLPEEVLQYLAPKAGGIYLDGTLGGAGHSAMIAAVCAPEGGLLIGVDRDQEALAAAGKKLAEFGNSVQLVHGNFAGLADYLADLDIEGLDGFLFDLGVSSHQLDSGERGFSFQQNAPLDMRMDGSCGETAADLVNELPEQELERILKEYGEERWAKRVAAFIVKARSEAPIETTFQLVDIIKGAIPKAKWEDRLHPATRTFQGLRIAVNHELESLERGLRSAIEKLKPGGRGVVISFHSLEDRIVKHVFKEYATGCICPRHLPMCVCGNHPKVKVLTGRPIMAGDPEIEQNPRARSAKLRAIEKL